MISVIMAGKSEKSAQIMVRTAGRLVMFMMVSPVAVVPEANPASPSNNATNDPEMAVPNFCAMVPEEKMSPVEDVPLCSVA